MGVKSLKMPPANQAFNRIAAEITLDLATLLKTAVLLDRITLT
jgi:hypothetical protein